MNHLNDVKQGVALALCSLGLVVSASSADAQVTLPDMPTRPVGRSTLPISAAEGMYHVAVQSARADADVSIYDPTYPIDTINQTIVATGERWLAGIKAKGAKGIQLDPAGSIAVAANEEKYANAQIASRLATPGLSLPDRAFTLMTAVHAFANEYYPARLVTAEAYLAQLDALGDSVALWQVHARNALVHTYFRLGRTPDVVRHGVRGLELVKVLRFNERYVVFNGSGLYNSTVAALAGQSGGRAKIDSLNVMLQAATKAPPEWLARDPGFAMMEAIYTDGFGFLAQANALVGRPGAALVSNFWVNRETRDSATIALNDGKVRVFELAGIGCAPCLEALQSIQRLGKQFPQIETLFLTATGGSWGNRFVDPAEEAGHISDFLLNTAKITMPIGIWKGAKQLNEDDGMTPVNAGPNFANYPTRKMSIWLVDGRGIVRRYFDALARKDEPELARMIHYLIQESKQQ